jgi:hypothetical protein
MSGSASLQFVGIGSPHSLPNYQKQIGTNKQRKIRNISITLDIFSP